MSTIGIVVGSTRPGRRGRLVAEWIARAAEQHRPDDEFEIVDLADYALPLLDEPLPAMSGRYDKDHTARWSEAVARFEGFVFVTPEYNHSIPGVLKNALDFLYREWGDKAAGIVSYGVHGGSRAAEHLRLVLAELRVATVRSQVLLSVFDEFKQADPADPAGPVLLTPGPRQDKALAALLDEVITWSEALRPVRDGVLA
ncbi:NADPH-dependent FMN reductase [Streptomyces sp. NPDC102467]|uniref:NADPH-dependent FMN reductase n=1 Tax=Streptomyces sp. NPDC102467 TaxID=3366179 RepID=UPI0037FDBD59